MEGKRRGSVEMQGEESMAEEKREGEEEEERSGDG